MKEPQVWDVLGQRGMKSLLIGVPPGYPPRAVEGWRVSCFLTPPSAETFTHPKELAAEMEEELGGEPYIFDIPNFRLKGEDVLLDQVFKMTERRFRVARRLVRTKPWDYFMLVEMGPDRLHHVFWHHFDPAHPKHRPGNRFETAFQDYYRFLDAQVGSLLEALPDDEDHVRSWFVYVVKLPSGVDRDAVMARLDREGIATAPYLPSIHLQSYMRERYGFAEGMLPVSEDCSARTMALPFHARLDRADQERVAEALRTALG